ncbi:hypothetical protein WIW50_15950 [Flavobacteriaceae bacterium 3-367]|uniref:hypothetical protein n=1 Tax=Eudoraea algarum TaxID=3417568 RepID=UPI0032691899
MVTFLTILFVLIAVNAALLVFSVNGTHKKSRKAAPASNIFPLDLPASKYKKAV